MSSAQSVSSLPHSLQEPPKLKGGLPLIGHIVEFARNPYHFMKRVSDELGEIAQFRLFGQRIILLTGDEASTVFYRGTDEQLDQSAAYKLMTPIFGEGIIFDAPNERKNQQLKMLMPALRMDAMRNHADKIVQEVEDMITRWGDAGEIDIVEEMKQLTINTASHCLLGKEFRYELTGEFASIYHDLEKGVNPLAYHFPNLPIPAFRKRDKARRRLQELVSQIVKKRQSQSDKPTDMFQLLIDTRYDDGSRLSENEITGMLIGAIFAGHHTSSGTAAWVLLELLKHPDTYRDVKNELDTCYSDNAPVTFQSLREIPRLEAVLKEVLRLHPPLIVLMRQVNEDLRFKHYRINKGDMVWASPPVTHRMSNLFRQPHQFDPTRYSDDRGEDRNLMAYQPFGGGKHKCSGNAFAMFQIKAIFALLLREYEFELVDAPETYVDDYGEMIVQPKSPCRIRYQRLSNAASKAGKPAMPQSAEDTTAYKDSQCPVHSDTDIETSAQTRAFTVMVDRQLCQGHAMCMGEASDVFHVDDNGKLQLLQENPPPELMDKVRNAVKHCPNQALSIKEN